MDGRGVTTRVEVLGPSGPSVAQAAAGKSGCITWEPGTSILAVTLATRERAIGHASLMCEAAIRSGLLGCRWDGVRAL